MNIKVYHIKLTLVMEHEQPIQNHIFLLLRYEPECSRVSDLYEWFIYYVRTELQNRFVECIFLLFLPVTFHLPYVIRKTNFLNCILLRLNKYCPNHEKMYRVEQYLDVKQMIEF
jgi:hypothetical protein